MEGTGTGQTLLEPAEQRARVVTRAEAGGLRLVRFLYCDHDGIIRGKASGVSRLHERLESGIGLTVAMQAFSLLDRLAPVEGMGPVGEIRLVPDPDTFVIAPYAPHTGVVLVDMQTSDRGPYAADGRHFLRRMIDRAASFGLELEAAFEPEWTLAAPRDDGWEPVDRSLCFSTHGMASVAEVIDDVVAALEAQGLQVEQYYPELGWGQQELSIRHAPALRAADAQLHYRETVRSVARKHGLAASFAPKPWPDQPGNGCHLHFSAWDRHGANRFADPGAPHGLSEVGRLFLAGVLDHLPGLLALTCASVNSYRRLQPQTWASAYRAWGLDNREAALRVASTFWGREAESTNVELKACDASSNPYLALGGVIAAGLDGIERGLEPPPPMTVDPHTLDDDARAAAGVTRHPRSLAEAIGHLRGDRLLTDALGDRLTTSYLAVKESDIAGFGREDEAFEYSAHRFRY
ncbi:MAG TPA: glutamine synthetase family protein [Candidatus Dormibacteraeota bacterium]